MSGDVDAGPHAIIAFVKTARAQRLGVAASSRQCDPEQRLDRRTQRRGALLIHAPIAVCADHAARVRWVGCRGADYCARLSIVVCCNISELPGSIRNRRHFTACTAPPCAACAGVVATGTRIPGRSTDGMTGARGIHATGHLFALFAAQATAANALVAATVGNTSSSRTITTKKIVAACQPATALISPAWIAGAGVVTTARCACAMGGTGKMVTASALRAVGALPSARTCTAVVATTCRARRAVPTWLSNAASAYGTVLISPAWIAGTGVATGGLACAVRGAGDTAAIAAIMVQ